jgi:hypothetical protein
MAADFSRGALALGFEIVFSEFGVLTYATNRPDRRTPQYLVLEDAIARTERPALQNHRAWHDE